MSSSLPRRSFPVEQVAESCKRLRQERAHLVARDPKILRLLRVLAEAPGGGLYGGAVQRSLVFGREWELEISMNSLDHFDAVRDDFPVCNVDDRAVHVRLAIAHVGRVLERPAPS